MNNGQKPADLRAEPERMDTSLGCCELHVPAYVGGSKDRKALRRKLAWAYLSTFTLGPEGNRAVWDWAEDAADLTILA